jgi:hypothetical protein
VGEGAAVAVGAGRDGVFGEGDGESFGAPPLQPTPPMPPTQTTQTTQASQSAERPKPIEPAADRRAAERPASLFPQSVILGRL